jgi:hypothetical protein
VFRGEAFPHPLAAGRRRSQDGNRQAVAL